MLKKPILIDLLRDLSATKSFANTIAYSLRAGDVIALAGDLGAGKTQLAKDMIQALSAQPVEVLSPSFALLQIYPVSLTNGATLELYHYDLYRIEHEAELRELELEETNNRITFIEWPERLGGMNIPVSLTLSLAIEDDQARTLTAYSEDAYWQKRMKDAN